MKYKISCLGIAGLLFAASAVMAEENPLTPKEMIQSLQLIDDRQFNSGDYKALAFVEQKQQGKTDLIYELLIFRRDKEDKLMMLFTKPKAEAGKGYLKVDKNLFMYDPTVGKWERRTERERIGGTDSQRSDYDESHYARDFTPSYVGVEKLGKFDVTHLRLNAKPEADVAYPVVDVWIDKATGNLLKAQQHALSGRLMRSSYYPEWRKMYSESKKDSIYFPRQIRIYDEVQKGNSTIVVLQDVELNALPVNIFTKAWLESKSR
jgi:Outer membrane lipoprotein-sorting protein